MELGTVVLLVTFTVIVIGGLALILFSIFCWPHLKDTPYAKRFTDIFCCHRRGSGARKQASSLFIKAFKRRSTPHQHTIERRAPQAMFTESGEAAVVWPQPPSKYKLSVRNFDDAVKAIAPNEGSEDDYIVTHIQTLPQAIQDLVSPFGVGAFLPDGIDYNAIVRAFGSSLIDGVMMERFERVTGQKAHYMLRRGIFFSHRDLDDILSLYAAGRPFYLYAARGPSQTMHLGHYVIFSFTRWLQKVFDVPLVIQLTDDEKFLWKNLKLEECRRLAKENIKDIIAIGFDPDRTFIFTDFDYISSVPEFYVNIVKVQRCVPLSKATNFFGFTDTDSVGKISFPAIQAAAAYSSSFPNMFQQKKPARCLIICALDQDPFCRLARDVASNLGFKKPAVLYSKFLPSLQSVNTKMSSNTPGSIISLRDTDKQIQYKIDKYASSGNGAPVEEHKENGGNCDVDISYQYLTFFLEDDDKLEKIRQQFTLGELTSDDMKAELLIVVQNLFMHHRSARDRIGHQMITKFMTASKYDFWSDSLSRKLFGRSRS